MSKRIPGILAVIVVIFLLMEMTFQTRQQENKEAVEPENVSPLLVWYTDPDIQTYMEETAAEASKSLGVEIQTELVSEVDYMENISDKILYWISKKEYQLTKENYEEYIRKNLEFYKNYNYDSIFE